MKVCHITSMHKPYDGRIFRKQCISLAKKYDVTLIQANTDDTVVDGVAVYGVKTPTSRMLRMMTYKPFLLKALEVDADIYHIHDPELLRIIPKLKQAGKKVIFDSHENFPGVLMIKEWMPLFMRKFVSKAYTAYERRCLKYTDAVFSVTPEIVTRLSRINPHSYLITNYPILIPFEDHRKWGRSVCFAGGVVRQWMHHDIINSLEKTDIQYRLAGGFGYESYSVELKQLPGWSKVDFLGKIPFKQVNDFIQGSSAAMALYTYDDPNVGYKEGTLGNQKFFEYMMAGVPLVTSHHRLWEEIVVSNNCGLCVDPDDHDALREAIESIVNNPETAKELGDNARKAAEEKYNWSTQEPTLFSAYEYVASL